MALIDIIEDNELGSSVRDKLNNSIGEANKLRDVTPRRLIGNTADSVQDADEVALDTEIESKAAHDSVPSTKAVNDAIESLDIPTDTVTLSDDGTFSFPKNDEGSTSRAIKAYVDDEIQNIDTTQLTKGRFKKFPVRSNVGSTFYRMVFYISEDNQLYAAGYGNGYNIHGGSQEEIYNFQRIMIPFAKGEYVEDVYYAGASAPNMYVKSNNGRVFAAGYGAHGQNGDGSTTNNDYLRLVPNLPPVKEFAAAEGWGKNETHCLAITTNNELWGWGRNNNGELGIGNNTDQRSAVKINVPFTPKKVFCQQDDGSSFVIDTNDNVWTTGENKYGTLGLGNNTNRNTWTNVPNRKADSIHCYGNATYLLRNGEVWATGYGGYGALGTGSTSNRNTFTRVLTGVSTISLCGGTADTSVLCLKSDGTIWGWGNNGHGELGLGDKTSRRVPTQVTAMGNDNAKVLCHDDHAFAAVLKNDGRLFTTGYNGYGQQGSSTTGSRDEFNQCLIDQNIIFKDFFLYGYNSGAQFVAVDTENNLWGCGYNGQFSLGMGEDRYNEVTMLTELRTY